MSESEREDFYRQLYAAFHTPQQAMAEGRPHRRATSAAFDALTLHFKSTGRMIYVADELAVVYPDEPSFSPDLIAVLDVAQPDPDEDERTAWMVADEGKGPDFILEVLHHGSQAKDLVKNVSEYARLGIREYFVYDRLRFKLYGFRQSRPGAPYQELRSRLGRMGSEVLGLDLALLDRRLRFFSGMGELMNSDEFIARLSKMMDGIEARAQQAEAQAKQALQEARDGVLDVAEACGLEVSPEQRQQLENADLEALRALRTTLKTTRAWPEG